MNRVKGKVAVVTGGGKNIGRGICLLLAKEGAKVCILDRDTESGKTTEDMIVEKNGTACFIKSDVIQLEDINYAMNKIYKNYDRIYILVNNVGSSKVPDLEHLDEKSFQSCIDANLKSAIFCTKTVLPFMITQGNGSVVFISSINATLGGFNETIYATAKGAIHSFIRALASDYSKYGIRFNVVSPGSVPRSSQTWLNRKATDPELFDKLSETAAAHPRSKLRGIAF